MVEVFGKHPCFDLTERQNARLTGCGRRYRWNDKKLAARDHRTKCKPSLESAQGFRQIAAITVPQV